MKYFIILTTLLFLASCSTVPAPAGGSGASQGNQQYQQQYRR